jgi:ribosomal protein L11 methyltransferase
VRTWPALVIAGIDQPSCPADLVEAALVGNDVSALEELSPDTWRVFFPTPAARTDAAAGIARDLPDLTLSESEVLDEDWAARSQASLGAISVGAIVVAPPWDVPPARTDAGDQGAAARPADASPLVVIIQPSMGFGTGHHATTRLCLAALQTIDLRGRAVLDVGTGSGVLAIAASLLGAASVAGIDVDPDAIASARENLDLNDAARVTFEVADLRAVTTPADVVLANLTGALLQQAAPLLQSLAADGVLILSGLMQDEEADVRRAFDHCRVERRDQEDEWLCLVLRPDGAT